MIMICIRYICIHIPIAIYICIYVHRSRGLQPSAAPLAPGDSEQSDSDSKVHLTPVLPMDAKLRKLLHQQSRASMGLELNEIYYLGSLLLLERSADYLLRRIEEVYKTIADAQTPLKHSYTELCIVKRKDLLISKLNIKLKPLLNLDSTSTCIDFMVYGKLFVANVDAHEAHANNDRFGSNASVFYSSAHFNHPLSMALDPSAGVRKDTAIKRTSTFTLVEMEGENGEKYLHPVELIALLVAFDSTAGGSFPERIEASQRCFALVRYLKRAEPDCNIADARLWRGGSASCSSVAQFFQR
jgi:hypothetical protein